jgi:hypothetical protein
MACDGESPVFFLKNIRTPITIKVPVKNGIFELIITQISVGKIY